MARRRRVDNLGIAGEEPDAGRPVRRQTTTSLGMSGTLIGCGCLSTLFVTIPVLILFGLVVWKATQ